VVLRLSGTLRPTKEMSFTHLPTVYSLIPYSLLLITALKVFSLAPAMEEESLRKMLRIQVRPRERQNPIGQNQTENQWGLATIR